MSKTIEDAKRLNRRVGQYFFEPNAMRFFSTRICGDIIHECYFITSEKFKGWRSPDGPRLYTVRKIDWETGHLDTYPNHSEGFQAHKTANAARNWLKRHLSKQEMAA